jgi:hypothetical protein
MTRQQTDIKARLFPGSFYSLLERTPQVHELLRRVQELAPQVLQDLHDQVLPLFRLALKDNQDDTAGFAHREAAWREPPWFTQRVRPMVLAWACRHHLLPPEKSGGSVRAPAFLACFPHPATSFGEWRLMPTTYATLLEWSRIKRKRPLAWQLLEWADLRTAFPTEPFRCQLVLDGWNALTETKTEARARLLAELEKRIKEYLDGVEEDARRQYGLRAPHQLSAEHLDWLVEYQVSGCSFRSLAAHYSMDRHNVAKAIKGIAELVIGPRWREWLRPSERGRPFSHR